MVDGYQAQLHQVGWSLCTISIIVILGRCYCRMCVIHHFGWDDGFMVFALVSPYYSCFVDATDIAIGSWHCVCSSSVDRSSLRVRIASCGYHGSSQSRTGADVHLYCARNLDRVVNNWKNLNGNLLVATPGFLYEKATSLVLIPGYWNYGCAQHLGCWYTSWTMHAHVQELEA